MCVYIYDSNSCSNGNFETWKIFFNCNMCVGANPCSIVANILDCDIVVSEFKLQSDYCSHFWTNTISERYKLSYPLQLWVKVYH